jgi:hypothetical protein
MDRDGIEMLGHWKGRFAAQAAQKFTKGTKKQENAGGDRSTSTLSVILCVRHNERRGAYYAEQSEESGLRRRQAAIDLQGSG